MNNTDKETLRGLAARWAEHAHDPVMAERLAAWRNVKDRKAKRPVVYVEGPNYMGSQPDMPLCCEDESLRETERVMRDAIRHVEVIGDDLVLEKVYPLPWRAKTIWSGVEVKQIHALDRDNHALAFQYNFPVQSPADIDRIGHKIYICDKQWTMAKKAILEDIFGDILPVEIRGANRPDGGLTRQVFELMGLETMLIWIYDEPDALHRLMGILRDETIAAYRDREARGLLTLNNNGTLLASGSPGYTEALPGPSYDPQHVTTKDLWGRMESQETSHVSPEHFAEFFLPYMAGVGKIFAMLYYGCCEQIHDRFEMIEKAMPNIRAVSISPWTDPVRIREIMGNRYAYSRKVTPSYFTMPTANWDAITRDLETTFAVFGELNTEIILRDVYSHDMERDLARLARWVKMARSYFC